MKTSSLFIIIATALPLVCLAAGKSTNYAPDSLAGYGATAQETGTTLKITLTFGADTYAQTGSTKDTNPDDFAVGSYTYLKTGANTAVITNTDVRMMSHFGVTNVTAIYVTFKNANSGSYTWTNDSASGTGKIKFTHLKNLAPTTVNGSSMSARGTTFNFANDGTFLEYKNGSEAGSGTYTFAPVSPIVGMLELVWTDAANPPGAVAYCELTFSSATKVAIVQSWYQFPSLDSDPQDFGQATGKIQ